MALSYISNRLRLYTAAAAAIEITFHPVQINKSLVITPQASPLLTLSMISMNFCVSK